MPQAEKKFHEFRNLIDPTLEAKTPIGLTGSAKRSGDELSVTLSVTAETDLPQTTTLKLFLVDETVRYLGGNGIRFHHQVVRGTVGPATGVKLSELQQGQWTASVRIPEVRRSLEDYLDEAAKDRPFPSPDRPTEFGTLKVIALVQDDDGGEVLQALELPITAS
jgi:hypothetical protein